VGYLAVLRRNPAASVFLIFFGIHSGMNVVPYFLSIIDLAAQTWGKSMTRYLVIFETIRLSLGLIGAGPFGRLGDRCGNFLVVCIMLALEVAPILSTLILGRNEAGLISFCALRALAGCTGASLTSAPCMYAYSHELVGSRDEYRLYTALIYGVTCSMTMGFFVLARSIDVTVGPTGMLWMGVVLCGIQMLMLAGMRMMTSARRAGPQDSALETSSSNEEMSESSTGTDDMQSAQSVPAKKSVLSWLWLVRNNPSLLRVSIIAMLVCLAEVVLHDVVPQYAFTCLDILTGKENGPERRRIAFVNSITTWTAISVSSMVVGWLQRCWSPFVLMKAVIIVIAAFQTLPVILTQYPTMAVLVVCSFSVGSAFLVLPILQALVPEVAPPDRTSEAIAAMAAFKNAAYLGSSLLLSVFLPFLHQSGLENPLWILFPVCGALALSALPLTFFLKPFPKNDAKAAPKM